MLMDPAQPPLRSMTHSVDKVCIAEDTSNLLFARASMSDAVPGFYYNNILLYGSKGVP